MTEFEYDAEDRIIRTVTTREPEWTEQDRAEILALGVYEASRCPCGCGLDAIDAQNPSVEFEISQSTCNARLALLEAQRGANEHRGSENAPARLWRIEKR